MSDLPGRYPQLNDGHNRFPPDGLRLFAVADGLPVSRPFHLRWLLPKVLGTEVRAWWLAWVCSWVVLAGGVVWWQFELGAGWERAVACSLLVCGLPGILGPPSVIPVGVDLGATACAVVAVAFTVGGNGSGWVAAAVIVACVAGGMKESGPVWAAVWAWHPLPLVGLVVPLIRGLVVRPGPDPLGDRFQFIADHPVRAALVAHSGRWRDGWLMVAPWGACLLGLGRMSWPLAVALVLAYGQLLVATDTVRLVHHGAGPVLASAAVAVCPVRWLPMLVVAHVVWWRKPERI